MGVEGSTDTRVRPVHQHLMFILINCSYQDLIQFIPKHEYSVFHVTFGSQPFGIQGGLIRFTPCIAHFLPYPPTHPIKNSFLHFFFLFVNSTSSLNGLQPVRGTGYEPPLTLHAGELRDYPHEQTAIGIRLPAVSEQSRNKMSRVRGIATQLFDRTLNFSHLGHLASEREQTQCRGPRKPTTGLSCVCDPVRTFWRRKGVC